MWKVEADWNLGDREIWFGEGPLADGIVQLKDSVQHHMAKGGIKDMEPIFEMVC